jgi:diguanylate cyclase (GGDEF)-like protein
MKNWILQSILKVEVLAVALLVMSLVSVAIFHTQRRELRITPDSPNWHTQTVDDRNAGGNSFAEDLSNTRQLRFAFKTVDAVNKSYALFLIMPSEKLQPYDLDWFETLTIKAHVKGDFPQQFLIQLKERVDHLFDKSDYASRKCNEAFFELTSRPQSVTIDRDNFSVPRWWIAEKAVIPEDSAASFKQFEWIEIAVCDPQSANQDTVVIDEISFSGPILSPVQFYQGLFTAWLFLATVLSFKAFRNFKKKRAMRRVRLNQLAQIKSEVHSDLTMGARIDGENGDAEQYDSLTQVLTKFGLQQTINQALDAVREGIHPVSIILFDVDDLRAFNHDSGNECGDQVLCQIAEIATQEIGQKQAFGRWGGDQFLVICQSQDRNVTRALASRLRSRIENETACTCSFGIHQLNPINTFDESIERVSRCIREAKFNGKNKVVMFSLRQPTTASLHDPPPAIPCHHTDARDTIS